VEKIRLGRELAADDGESLAGGLQIPVPQAMDHSEREEIPSQLLERAQRLPPWGPCGDNSEVHPHGGSGCSSRFRGLGGRNFLRNVVGLARGHRRSFWMLRCA